MCPSPWGDSTCWSAPTPAARQGYLEADCPKPERPKEAVESALWQVRRPRSSALYRQLASQVSFKRCTDPAFGKLKATLQRWFAA